MSHHQGHPHAAEGIGLEDFPLIARSLFDLAVRGATLHDPRSDPDGFIEALWAELANAFEWTPQPWPQDLPLPPLAG